MRRRLFDIDLLLLRTALYSSLAVFLLGCYLAASMAFAALFGSADWTAPVTAALVMGLVFHPAHVRGRRFIDSRLYGDRRDPLRVLAAVSASALEEGSSYDNLVRALAGSMRLHYVAVDVSATDEPNGGLCRVATFGSGSDAPAVEIPIVCGGKRLGRIVVATRSRWDPLDPDELALLGAVATQVGANTATERIAHELQLSRERIVQASEEERRRLRRDLHDGMGARLAAIGYTIEAASRTAARGPNLPRGGPSVAEALERTKRDLIDTVADLRRIIDDLRPESLDDLGLADALTGSARRILDGAGITLRASFADADDGAVPIDAATEAALYRIGLEAVTNVANHSHASRSLLELTWEGDSVVLRIDDDGIGVPAQRPGAESYHRAGGVGVPSMHERAAELGGTLTIGERPGGGTAVMVRLPCGTGGTDG